MAILDRREPAHSACVDVVAKAPGPLVTTWPCATEAMFVLGTWPAQSALWDLLNSDGVLLMDLDREGRSRAAELMGKYADRPMSLADATLVVLAERLGQKTVFTLDGDFEVYRLHGRRAIDVVPSPPQ